MANRRRDNLLPARLRFGRLKPRQPTAPARRRRVSRREREARQRRRLYWGMGIAGALVVLILLAGVTNEYIIKPRHVLAEVDGTKIRRRDYWKVRSIDLINQISQYQQFASFLQGSQQQQYRARAQQAATELNQVWGSTKLDQATLAKMIDDQVFLHSLDKMGISISDQDVNDYIEQQFQPSDAPIFTPTPSPTLIPTRAAWATQTAAARLTPSASPGAASPAASPAAAPSTPAAAASPGVPSAGATPAGTPAALASPIASPAIASSPLASPAVSPTPNQAQARQTAEAGFKQYREAVFNKAHLSRSEYVRLIVRPAVARQKITAQLTAPIGQTAEQVHAAHILVGTKDLADSIFKQVTQPDANFEQIAKDQSTDKSTAPNGGDLGWFTKGVMVAPFEKAAFAQAAGQIPPPVQTQFGWHVIKVYAHEQDRPLTNEQISRLKDDAVKQWLNQRRSELNVSSDLKPTPTPAAPQFVPPPGAPPLPTPTPTPAATPLPVASPRAGRAGSPIP